MKPSKKRYKERIIKITEDLKEECITDEYLRLKTENEAFRAWFGPKHAAFVLAEYPLQDSADAEDALFTGGMR